MMRMGPFKEDTERGIYHYLTASHTHTQQLGQKVLRGPLKAPCRARLGGSLERGQGDKTTGIMSMLGNSDIQLVAPAAWES